LFIEHGDIAVAKVVKDKLSKKSLGYGFVKFVREEDAASAIELKNGFLMGHKKLKVSLARPPSTEIRNCKLYITNLPKEFTEREVIELFSQVSDNPSSLCATPSIYDTKR
jgi:RNA recognition motif-containing protein